MDISLYNTLTGKKEPFVPLHDDFVGMYHCGPTVYQYAHIGNMRSYVFADILRRTMEFNGKKVKQVLNITDVGHLTSDADSGDDKVEREARKEGKTAREVTDFFTEAFMKDIAMLNVETTGTVSSKRSTKKATPIRSPMGCILIRANLPRMESSETSISKDCRKAPEWKRTKKSAIRPISRFGNSRHPKRSGNRNGRAHGASDSPAGISNAQLCR
jgi:hypothetical protein